MSEHTRKDDIIRRVVSALQTAPSGSQELDCMISYALELARGEFDQVMMQLLVSEGYSWNVISEIWEGKVARYTQRSEEHTSELQSLMRISYAVFCLKKKKNTNIITTHFHSTNKENII